MKNPTKSKSKLIDSYVFDLMDALTSPILTHAQSWADCIPERMLKIVTPARIASILQKEKYATEPEIVIFIYTRSLESPMSSNWNEIYFHFTCKVLQQYFKEDHWNAIQAKKELDDYEIGYFVKPLRNFIYKKRRETLKQRMKESAKEAKVIDEYLQMAPICAAEEQTKTPDLIEGHYNLWDS